MQRTKVVLDTNVVLAAFLTRQRARSPSHRIFRAWFVLRRFKLVLSDPLLAEYLEALESVAGFGAPRLNFWQTAFRDRRRAIIIQVGTRYGLSRDPDDNMVLDTAAAGRARFLVTNDRDLLDIPAKDLKRIRRTRLTVIHPTEFIEWLASHT